MLKIYSDMSKPKKKAVSGVKKQSTDLVESPYTATLVVLGKKFSASGLTISDAISKLNPGIVRGKTILTLSKDEKSKERLLMPLPAMRLFNTAGISREIHLKQISSLFTGFDT